MSYFIEGILFGLMLAVMVGPIFIAITQTSMEKGILAGMLVSLGEWVSDIIIIALAYFFIKAIIEIQKKKHTYKNLLGFWLKGFLVNTINPFTFIFWIGVISTYVIGRNATGSEAFTFLGAILATIVIMDVIKVYGAKAIRKKLSPSNLFWFSKLSGVGLAAFGLYLIYQVV